MVSPKTLDLRLVTAGAKEVASRRNAMPPKFVKNAATDFHRFDFDGMRHKHGGYLKRLASISLSRLHWEQDKLTQSQLLVMQSAIIHLTIFNHHQSCLHNMRKLPHDHLVLAILACNYIQLYTCRSSGCFTSCFLIGAMRWLSCKSTAKEVHLRIWPGPTKHFRPPNIRCCQSGDWNPASN